jgi:hypothetical protein
MIGIKFKVDPASVKKVEGFLQNEVAKITGQVAQRTYNSIVTNDGQYPYWSGAYISSWTIQAGSPKFVSNEGDTNQQGKYAAPSPVTGFKVSFGVPIYITNAADHAYQVEYMGTPTHKHEGWFTANHAVYQTVLSYRFKFTT